MNCCKNSFQICQPIPSCFDTMDIFCPIDYPDETIDLVFTNSQGVSQSVELLDVVGGKVELAIDELTSGFISQYGGPYTLQFVNEAGQILTDLLCSDGNRHDSIEFIFNNLTKENVSLNAFT